MSTRNLILAIDDDKFDNFLTSVVCKYTHTDAEFRSYTDSSEGLENLKLAITNGGYDRMILFLDLLMPGKNGWEILDLIDEINLPKETPLEIYILSVVFKKSLINQAVEHRFVRKFIEKPITIEKMKEIILA